MAGLINAGEYDDAETYRAQLIGWDREITQLEPGPLRLGWRQISIGDVVVAEGLLGRTMADWSTVAAGRLNFVVSLGGPHPTRWCGLEALPGCALVAGAGRDFHSIARTGFRSLEFIVPEALFPELRGVAGGPIAPDFSPQACLVRLDPALEAHMAQLGSVLFGNRLTTDGLMTNSLWSGALRQRVLELLHMVARRIGEPVRASPAERPIPGYAMTIRATHYMDANAPFLDRIAEVAEAVGVSTRALQQAFRSYMGISPHQYLLARKLHLARRHLSRATLIRAPVTDAAMSAGLTHLGRFSAYYRQLFAEEPRATLARARAGPELPQRRLGRSAASAARHSEECF